MKPRVFVWTGGSTDGAGECHERANALPSFPRPAPLRRAAIISYRWGGTLFEVISSACSIRTTPWGDGQMTWLHCKATQIAKVATDQPTGLMTLLLPVLYITGIRSGPTFRVGRSRKSEDDIGVFPPSQPAPPGALSLAEVEQAIAELLSPERN